MRYRNQSYALWECWLYKFLSDFQSHPNHHHLLTLTLLLATSRHINDHFRLRCLFVFRLLIFLLHHRWWPWLWKEEIVLNSTFDTLECLNNITFELIVTLCDPSLFRAAGGLTVWIGHKVVKVSVSPVGGSLAAIFVCGGRGCEIMAAHHSGKQGLILKYKYN